MKEQRIALITGCSSGIGKQLALAFAKRGVTVLATARRPESLQELTSQYDNIEAFTLDLNDLNSIHRLKEAVAKRTSGLLDFLVNNAGTHYAATCLDQDIKEVMELFKVNLFAVMQLCQAFVPLLRKSDCARIVQIGSVTRVVPVAWQGAYNASKAALSQYTKTLRLEVAPLRIEVIEIVTGFVRSNILQHGLYAPENSLYLPIKDVIEKIKYEGNANGMATEAYAATVVNKLMQKHVSPEIWDGALASYIRFLVTFLPLRVTNWIFYHRFGLDRLENLL